jgi:hypothetical protein
MTEDRTIMRRVWYTALSIAGLTTVWLAAGHGAQAAPPAKTAARLPSSVAAEVDRLIDARLMAGKIPASPQADDAEFLRRACLDITGRIPTAERTAAFLADSRPDKRAKLIDELLADREYGEHFATIWYHRMVKPDDDNRRQIANNKMVGWLTERFNQNQGWDRLVTDILTASGDREKHPETLFFLAHVGGGKQGQPEPNKLTAAATRLFMGVRLECCECHNHPFTKLQQTDFWSMAAFFSTTHGNDSSVAAIKGGATPAIQEGNLNGRVVRGKAKKEGVAQSKLPVGSIEIPDTKGKTVRTKFLGGPQAPSAPATHLRAQLAAWLTGPSNPYFARAAANKLWANFFGRGIVTPVDDMRPENEVTHPEILQLLSREFVASGFDQKYLIRCICLSQAYQRSSRVLPGNKEDDSLYSHMQLKMMTADMLFDSLGVALGHTASSTDRAADKKTKKYTGTGRDEFRKFFHAEADDDVGVAEDYTHGVPQVLRLMNSSHINDTAGVVQRLMKANAAPATIIENLYLRVLARRPTETETKRMTAYVASEQNAPKAYGDLIWILLNSGEFLFNH